MNGACTTSKPQHIGIAGAGLLGRLLAWLLSREGHQVEVFDPAPDATTRGAAGWTAAGMLSPVAELECADLAVASLGWRSLDLWQFFVTQWPQDVYFKRLGSWLLAHSGDLGSAQRFLQVLQNKSESQFWPQPVNQAQLRAQEPSVVSGLHAWHVSDEGQIHTVQAMAAMADAATRQGVTWHWGHTVSRLSAGHIDGRSFDHVFDVRGTGARLPKGPASPTPSTSLIEQQVRGVRGEIFWLQTQEPMLTQPVRLMHPRWRVYLVPRPDNILVVGASEIESDDRSPISVRTTLGLLSAAHSVLPDLAESRIVHSEVNLRPALHDNLPRIEHESGLTRINGLFRHGWLIAPALVEQALSQAGLCSSLLPSPEPQAA